MMTVRELITELEDIMDEDLEVRFLLEQHRTNLQYDIDRCDVVAHGSGDAVYLTGGNEDYGPSLD